MVFTSLVIHAMGVRPPPRTPKFNDAAEERRRAFLLQKERGSKSGIQNQEGSGARDSSYQRRLTSVFLRPSRLASRTLAVRDELCRSDVFDGEADRFEYGGQLALNPF